MLKALNHTYPFGRKRNSDVTLSPSDFEWNEASNEYRCPEGHPLKSNWRPFKYPRSHIKKADTILSKASRKHCTNCPIKEKCCPNTPTRKVVRSLYEPARDVASIIAKTEAYLQSRKDRKKVEMLFARLKCILKLDRLRLLGMSGAQDEFLIGGYRTKSAANGDVVGSNSTQYRNNTSITAEKST